MAWPASSMQWSTCIALGSLRALERADQHGRGDRHQVASLADRRERWNCVIAMISIHSPQPKSRIACVSPRASGSPPIKRIWLHTTTSHRWRLAASVGTGRLRWRCAFSCPCIAHAAPRASEHRTCAGHLHTSSSACIALGSSRALELRVFDRVEHPAYACIALGSPRALERDERTSVLPAPPLASHSGRRERWNSVTLPTAAEDVGSSYRLWIAASVGTRKFSRCGSRIGTSHRLRIAASVGTTTPARRRARRSASHHLLAASRERHSHFRGSD